jgi:phosphomannomutase
MALIISVSGMRGVVGRELTPQVAVQVGCAFGHFLGGGKVVLASDTRPSGAMVRAAVASGLMATGCTVVDLGVVTTPGAGLMVRSLGADGGVVVTASHNPPEYNGIKLLSGKGWALPAEQMAQVRQIFDAGDFELADGEHSGAIEDESDTHERHIAAVLGIVDAGAIAARRLRVVLDSINGAGCVGTPMLLAKLGCEVVHINAEPHGRFAHMPEPIEPHLGQLCQAVACEGADVGFAQDPDADRLVIVDECGRFIGEEYTLALAVQQVLGQRPGAVATNLSTSRLIDDIAARAGCHVHRTPVGEANVAQAIVEHGCIIGGEGNGGIIDPRVVPVRDSFTAIGLICQLLADSGKSVSELVGLLPRYVMIKEKFRCDAARVEGALKAVEAAFGGGRINRSDGVRVDLEGGWVHVRASNTEPIMRVIAEAADEQTARGLAERARSAIDAHQ